MLYARCGNCAAVIPLWCTGQFMPHAPLAPVPTQYGAYCSMCGVLPPIFTCGYCWCRQFLIVQGAQPAAMPAMSPGQPVAAAVQAPANASQSTLKTAFAEVVKNAAGEIGKGIGQAISRSWQ